MDEMSAVLARLESQHQRRFDELRRTRIAINELHELYGKPAPYPDVEVGPKLDPTLFQLDKQGQPKPHGTLSRWKLKTGPKPKSQHNSN